MLASKQARAVSQPTLCRLSKLRHLDALQRRAVDLWTLHRLKLISQQIVPTQHLRASDQHHGYPRVLLIGASAIRVWAAALELQALP